MEHARNHLTAEVQSYSITGRHRLKSHSCNGVRSSNGSASKTGCANGKCATLPDTPCHRLPKDRNYSTPSAHAMKRTANDTDFTCKIHTASAPPPDYSPDRRHTRQLLELNKEFIFSPRASLTLIPAFNEKFTLRVAAGVYYQAPFYKEFRILPKLTG